MQSDDAKRSSACAALPPEFLRELAEFKSRQRRQSQPDCSEDRLTSEVEDVSQEGMGAIEPQNVSTNARGNEIVTRGEAEGYEDCDNEVTLEEVEHPMTKAMGKMSLVELYGWCRRRDKAQQDSASLATAERKEELRDKGMRGAEETHAGL